MPALHRMPITYLTILVVGIGAAIVSLTRPGGSETTNPIPADTTASAKPAESKAPVPPAPAPDDGILRTTGGLRRKVLVRSTGLRFQNQPQGVQTVGREPGLYSLAYVYGEAAEAFRVGPAVGPPIGWLPKDGLIEWDTRLMARPTSPDAVMFVERSCLLDDLAGRACARHPSGCPKAVMPQDRRQDKVPMGLPVIVSESIPQPDGPERTIFEVASPVRERGAMAEVKLGSADQASLRDVYVAIVLATSPSMTTFIETAREAARALADEATRKYPEIRLKLALVEYRDDRNAELPDGFQFVTKIRTAFVEPGQFLKALEEVRASTYRDGTMDERPLEGVATALPGPRGDPVASINHLSWPAGRDGDLAAKLLVLIGDAPDHEPDGTRIERLTKTARESRITVAAVSIANPSLNPGERERYQREWSRLAEESYRPLDRAAGFQKPIEPIAIALERSNELIPTLRRLIDDRVESARQLAILARAEAEGKLTEYTNREGLTIDQIAPVLEDLQRAVRPPEERVGEGSTTVAPRVERGWIAREKNGRPLVSLELLMSREELDRLIDDLRGFHQAILSDAATPAELIRTLSSSASGDRGFLDRDRGNETFADYLLKQGLPPSKPGSLLRRRQLDLTQTGPLLRVELEAALSRAVARLIERRESGDWLEPARLVDRSMSWVPYEPIDF